MQKEKIKEIINRHLDGSTVRIFGLRIDNRSTERSDIDVAIDASHRIDLLTMANIKYDFEESDIPYRVDIVDYNSVSKNFKKIIGSSTLEI